MDIVRFAKMFILAPQYTWRKKSKANLWHSYFVIVFLFKTIPKGNTGLAVYPLSARIFSQEYGKIEKLTY